MVKCPNCNRWAPTCIIRGGECEWCLSKEVRMKGRQNEVYKIAKVINSPDKHNAIIGWQDALITAEHLVNNGIRSKDGFKAVEVLNAQEKGLTDFGFVFAIEPKEYKKEEK